MRRIIAQARKELTQISRDKLAWRSPWCFPLFLLLLLGNAIALTVTDLPLVVQDFDEVLRNPGNSSTLTVLPYHSVWLHGRSTGLPRKPVLERCQSRSRHPEALRSRHC